MNRGADVGNFAMWMWERRKTSQSLQEHIKRPRRIPLSYDAQIESPRFRRARSSKRGSRRERSQSPRRGTAGGEYGRRSRSQQRGKRPALGYDPATQRVTLPKKKHSTRRKKVRENDQARIHADNMRLLQRISNNDKRGSEYNKTRLIKDYEKARKRYVSPRRFVQLEPSRPARPPGRRGVRVGSSQGGGQVHTVQHGNAGFADTGEFRSSQVPEATPSRGGWGDAYYGDAEEGLYATHPSNPRHSSRPATAPGDGEDGRRAEQQLHGVAYDIPGLRAELYATYEPEGGSTPAHSSALHPAPGSSHSSSVRRRPHSSPGRRPRPPVAPSSSSRRWGRRPQTPSSAARAARGSGASQRHHSAREGQRVEYKPRRRIQRSASPITGWGEEGEGEDARSLPPASAELEDLPLASPAYLSTPWRGGEGSPGAQGEASALAAVSQSGVNAQLVFEGVRNLVKVRTPDEDGMVFDGRHPTASMMVRMWHCSNSSGHRLLVAARSLGDSDADCFVSFNDSQLLNVEALTAAGRPHTPDVEAAQWQRQWQGDGELATIGSLVYNSVLPNLFIASDMTDDGTPLLLLRSAHPEQEPEEAFNTPAKRPTPPPDASLPTVEELVSRMPKWEPPAVEREGGEDGETSSSDATGTAGSTGHSVEFRSLVEKEAVTTVTCRRVVGLQQWIITSSSAASDGIDELQPGLPEGSHQAYRCVMTIHNASSSSGGRRRGRGAKPPRNPSAGMRCDVAFVYHANEEQICTVVALPFGMPSSRSYTAVVDVAKLQELTASYSLPAFTFTTFELMQSIAPVIADGLHWLVKDGEKVLSIAGHKGKKGKKKQKQAPAAGSGEKLLSSAREVEVVTDSGVHVSSGYMIMSCSWTSKGAEPGLVVKVYDPADFVEVLGSMNGDAITRFCIHNKLPMEDCDEVVNMSQQSRKLLASSLMSQLRLQQQESGQRVVIAEGVGHLKSLPGSGRRAMHAPLHGALMWRDMRLVNVAQRGGRDTPRSLPLDVSVFWCPAPQPRVLVAAVPTANPSRAMGLLLAEAELEAVVKLPAVQQMLTMDECRAICEAVAAAVEVRERSLPKQRGMAQWLRLRAVKK